MISVIIPVYNGEKYIERILNDLSKQTYKDFEVIFVNDGSIDQTKRIIEKSIERFLFKIKLISQVNKGVSAARNAGIAASVGKYIAFIDVDDGIEKEYLNKLHQLITYEKADIAICAVNKNGVEKKEKTKITNYNKEQILYQNLSGKLKVGVWANLINRDLIYNNKISFPNGYKYSEDLYFMWKVFAYANKVTITTEKLYIYHVVDGSAMSKFDDSRLDSIKLYEELLDFFKIENFSFYKKFKSKEIPRIYWSITWQAAYHMDYKSFRLFLSKNSILKEVAPLLLSHEIIVLLSTWGLFISKRLFCFFVKKANVR